MSEVRPASADDLEAMRAAGAAAGERFRTIDDPRIARCADDPPWEVAALAEYVAAGRAWVATAGRDIAGFVLVDVLDGCAHVEEISVHPGRQGSGLGSALLEAVDRFAATEGLAGTTLTTFAEVPWNRPFYERRGYRVLGADELTPGLVARIREEAEHGLDPALRVAMRRP